MLTDTETKLLGVMMMVIMLGMGASLTFKDFAIALRKPQGIAVGLVCQYGLMPALAYGLSVAMGLPPAYAVGLILMGCMPGGTTSNIFTYFSKGTLSLSILMTVSSTLVAIVMVPLTLAFYSSGIEGEWQIPSGNVLQVLVVLLVPTLLGIWQLLLSTGAPVYVGSIGLGLVGMALGYGLSRALRQDNRRSRTIAMETGIQNGPLAVLIVVLSFTGTQQQEVLLIPVLYSLFIVLTSTAVTLWFRRLTTREELARDQAKIGAMATA
jgi:predicted Na+-dependent transporter